MIYFDNNASTPLDKDVAEVVLKYMCEEYANPNSLHEFGVKMDAKIEEARFRIAKYLGCMPFEIYFTSCATESINWALRGVCKANTKYGKHIVSSNIEHSATLNTLKSLESEGFEVTYIQADQNGEISLEKLSKVIREDTILVSIMAANNEIGTIQDIKGMSQIIKEKNKNCYFHVDAVQIAGKINFSLKEMKCDLASFSSHKFHGPKGVGILFKKERTRIFPFITGGSQERGMRGGTQNVPGIIGTALALEKSFEHLEYMKEIRNLRDFMALEIEKMGGKILTPISEKSVPNTLAVFFEGVRGDIIVNALSDEEIFVSTSAACSSKGVSGSKVMKALGYDNEQSKGMIRISLSYLNNREETEIFLNKLKNILVFLNF
jgi:cysteine desulfurase